MKNKKILEEVVETKNNRVIVNFETYNSENLVLKVKPMSLKYHKKKQKKKIVINIRSSHHNEFYQ